MKRALKLVAEGNTQLVIVVPGSNPTSLAMMLQLRDIVPKMIVLAKKLDETARLSSSFPHRGHSLEVIPLEA